MFIGNSAFLRVAMRRGAREQKNAMKGCWATAAMRLGCDSPNDAPTIVTRTLTSTSE
jgi:hypothetical protein